MAKNHFESLLANITDAEVKEQLQGLSAKVPELDKWVIDPDRVEQIETWFKNNWDEQAGMPFAEKLQRERITQLEAELVTKGNSMTPEELAANFDKFMQDKGLVAKSDMEKVIKEKEDGFNEFLNRMSATSVRVPYLNSKYKDEFGEYFDPDAFLKAATDAGATDLDKFYERDYVAPKRTEAMEARHKAELEAARTEGKREGLQERVSVDGQMPTLDGSPDLGHFQSRIMNNGFKPAETSKVPVDAELGRGQISRIAAREGDLAALQGRVQ